MWNHFPDLFTAATVLLAMDLEGQAAEDNKATTQAFKQCLTTLGEMRDRSSMVQSYVTILEEARRSMFPHESATLTESSSSRPRSRLAAGRNPTSDALAMTPQMLGLDEYWQQGDSAADMTLPSWDMQDLFMAPWDMMIVDNPMQSFE